MNIIIIGASSGIGRELSKQYWQRIISVNHISSKNYSLHLIARNLTSLQELKQELEQENKNLNGDLTNNSKSLGLLNSRFYKKILGIFFFSDAVYKDIHEEAKKKITTNFAVKVREFNSPKLEIYSCDVSNEKAINNCLNNIIADCQIIDLIIYGSAIYRPNNSANFDLSLAKETININIGGVANCLAPIIPQLIKQKSGHLVLIASVAGYRGLPNSGFYGASKAAMINLAETLYAELSSFNIKVSLVNPGFVKTRLTDLNNFKMPFIISATEASSIIIKGIDDNKFEIHFPKKFTFFLKLIRILPNFIFLKIAKKIAKNS